ncbi:MAG: cytochrome c biogenesis protein CcsA, partial [Burkholderiales bacterium]
FPGRDSGALAASFEFKLHLVVAMLAYSLFTIAILHALLMALLERRLHGSAAARGGTAGDGAAVLAGPLGALPPLLTLERLLFRMIAAAFALLTLTLASGIVFSESLFGRALRFDHKTLFAVLSWATFAVLLAGRYLYGWRGRVALRWTLSGFVMLLLAYVGSRFVLEVILGRS